MAKAKHDPIRLAAWRYRNISIDMWTGGKHSPRLWVAIGSCCPALWCSTYTRITLSSSALNVPTWKIEVREPGDEDNFWSVACDSETGFIEELYNYCYDSRLPSRDVVKVLFETMDL